VAIRVAARSEAWYAFTLWNTGIVGSNPTQCMDVCVRFFCVCVVLCVGSGLATGWSPVQGVLLTVYRIKNLKKSGQSPTKGCGAIIISLRCRQSLTTITNISLSITMNEENFSSENCWPKYNLDNSLLHIKLFYNEFTRILITIYFTVLLMKTMQAYYTFFRTIYI
jgi:hypothetical protein